jgi:AraC-like DNA-binding protein
MDARVAAGDPARGILDFRLAMDRFQLYRYSAAADLRAWVESYWAVVWDVPAGQTHRQTNLSHTSINVAVEPEGAFVYGVPDRTFVRTIAGRGRVFGVKFRPGGFYPFHGKSVAWLTRRVLPVDQVLGPDGASWAVALAGLEADAERVLRADRFWRERRPRDATGASGPSMATLAVERIRDDRSIVSVERAACVVGMEIRPLPRLFRRVVGGGPKEVIRRFRLQEAAERLAREPGLTCGELAVELGYFDQAHFIRDFKATVGVTPERYRRRQAPPG